MQTDRSNGRAPRALLFLISRFTVSCAAIRFCRVPTRAYALIKKKEMTGKEKEQMGRWRGGPGARLFFLVSVCLPWAFLFAARPRFFLLARLFSRALFFHICRVSRCRHVSPRRARPRGSAGAHRRCRSAGGLPLPGLWATQKGARAGPQPRAMRRKSRKNKKK
nr:hypothetical protein [Pandoravirus belohorizontensis]